MPVRSLRSAALPVPLVGLAASPLLLEELEGVGEWDRWRDDGFVVNGTDVIAGAVVGMPEGGGGDADVDMILEERWEIYGGHNNLDLSCQLSR